jgi:YidC/Oxa1 family membrane protein insertase
MNKVMLYLFPLGVVVGAPFLPLAVLLYWVSNNLWTLGQQYIVYKRIDTEQTAKRAELKEIQQARAPRPGQKPEKPVVAETAVDTTKPKPGAKPVARKVAGPNGSPKSGPRPGAKPAPASSNGSSNGASNGAAKSTSSPAGDSARGASNGSAARPPARRPRKRR